MKVLKAQVDTEFGSNDDCNYGNVLSRPVEKTIRMKSVQSVTPFLRQGEPSFIIVLKSGKVYHATHELFIENID